MTLLSKITRGKVAKPPRLIVAGVAGVGKSTFASQFPDPLFIDAERRTEHLDVKRLEVDSWDEVMESMREVLKAIKAGDKPCKTMVFDTVDHIELLIYAHLCEQAGVASIEDVGGGYGKGYTAALDQWQKFAKGLEALRNAGIATVLLAHTHVKTFKSPDTEDYDQWVLKMNKKASDYLKERCDVMGFARFRTYVKSEKGGMKSVGKASSSGERILCFGHSPAYESKQGLNLPNEMPLDYEAFRQALEAGKASEEKAA